MTLKADMTADLENIFDTDEFAEVATYTTKAGVAASVSVIRQDAQTIADRDWQTSNARSAVLQVKQADIAAPAPNDKITIGSDTYTVVGIMGGNGYLWFLGCEIHG
jgi:hypothetical protein